MTSIIRLEVLSGAMDEAPLCYLLQVDEFHFLLDCGWDEHFNIDYINNIKKYAGKIDAVLLSYSDASHLGALPYLVGKCGLNCPVYATVPVYKMGQMFMYDWYQSHQNGEEFGMFTLDDVDAAFDKILQLKYSQNVGLKGRGHGLQITPFPAGHMIGGTVWRILKSGEEEIVYAVDFNHKKERHLNGCTFEGISRPNLLITDAYNATYQQLRRKQRDEQLLTLILQTVRSGGNTLVVIDTAGRVLELAQLLDQLWNNAEAGLAAYSLVLLNNVAYNVVEFAKSQVEWMSDKLLKTFEEGRNNPFHFRHVQICHSLTELRKVRTPMVALASSSDMEAGFSRDLFIEWCPNPKNTIIITSRSYPGTLSRMLIDRIKSGNKQLTLEIRKRVRLEGAELEEFVRNRRRKEQEQARARLEAQRRISRHETEISSGESSEDEADRPEQAHPYDVMLKFDNQQKSSFFKQAKRLYPMYPYVEEKKKWDDYGEIIRPDDYMIIEPSNANTAALSGLDTFKKEDGTEDGMGLSEGAAAIQAQFPSVEIPTKCVRYVQKIEVLSNLAFIDFEGRSDGDSIKKLISSQIRPKQLAVIHGTPADTAYLADYCKTVPGVTRVFTPKVGDIVDATIESHIFQVTLTDVLMSSLEFQRVKDAELAWIDARMCIRRRAPVGARTSTDDENPDAQPGDTVEPMDTSTSAVTPATSTSADATSSKGTAVTEKPSTNGVSATTNGTDNGTKAANSTSEAEEDEGSPTLELLASADLPAHRAVFVNDPKLSDLKQILMGAGFQAEFSAGVLYVNNVVSIRRHAGCRFHIEGTTCEDYFRIREVLYSQFAIV